MAFPSLPQTSTEYECESILTWVGMTRNGKKGKPQGMTLFNLLFLKLVQQAQGSVPVSYTVPLALQLPQGRLQTQG